MMAASLTAEQQRRIEENKTKAMARLAEKKHTKSSTASVSVIKTCNSSVLPSVSTLATHNKSYAVIKPMPSNETTSVSSTSKVVSINDNNNFTSSNKTVGSSRMGPTAASVQSNLERAEQNRLKALAKRAVKQNQSPDISRPCTAAMQDAANNEYTNSNYSTQGHSRVGFQSKPNLVTTFCDTNIKSNAALQNQNVTTASYQTNAQKPNTGKTPNTFQQQTSFENFQKGTNIFATYSGQTVKGDCVIVSRDRFEVKSGYSAPLVELFKSMNTKLYGEYYIVVHVFV